LSTGDVKRSSSSASASRTTSTNGPPSSEQVVQVEEQALAVRRPGDFRLEMRRQELGQAVLGVDRAVLREGRAGPHERMEVLVLHLEAARRPAQVHDVRAAGGAAHRRRELRVLTCAPDCAPTFG